MTPNPQANDTVRSANAEPSYLDYKTNNRNNRPTGRKKNCGRFSLKGIDLRTPGPEDQIRFARVNCNCWDCSYCGPRKQRMLRQAIGACAESLALNRFLTLTLDPTKFLPGISYEDFRELHECDPEKQNLKKLAAKHLRETFNKFRVYLGRKYSKAINYICVLEMHQSGMPHLHLLIDRFIEITWIRDVWSRIGGGVQVRIERVGIRNCSAYISKYLAKQLSMRVPPRTRRITTSRSIRLLIGMHGPSYIEWELRDRSIWEYWNTYVDTTDLESGSNLLSFDLDNEGYLQEFAIKSDNQKENAE